jgi:diguanylate cyclase (GGDEF)-like protein
MAISFTDVTDSKVNDVLTGLPNRSLFMDRAARALLGTRRHPDLLFAVLFIDLDRFKVINDSLGHAAGDELLIQVAERLEGCIRSEDSLARLGGDEFAILLSDIGGIKDAVRVAERVQLVLGVSFQIDGREVFTSASIGIALSSTGYERAEDILRDADTAMYRAKGLGKARHEVFDAEMRAQVVSVLRLETDLRFALERNELRLFYQPVISLQTGTITGFEALVRWEHPERGLIPPGEFIPLAEETGLIIAIDRWVLLQACVQLHAFQKLFPRPMPLTMSVNVSGKHFRDQHLLEHVEQALASFEVSPSTLVLELTETSLMKQTTEELVTFLDGLHHRHVRLAMDDFGTGYSSLSYLHQLSFDLLKIDRSFVCRLGQTQKDFEIVQTMVVLAFNLGIKVVAEGVETKEQLDLLRQMGCDAAQGYLFSRPVPLEKATILLEEGPRW